MTTRLVEAVIPSVSVESIAYLVFFYYSSRGAPPAPALVLPLMYTSWAIHLPGLLLVWRFSVPDPVAHVVFFVAGLLVVLVEYVVCSYVADAAYFLLIRRARIRA